MKKPSKLSTELLIGAVVTVGLILFIALMCFWGCLLYHKYGKKQKSYDGNGEDGMYRFFLGPWTRICCLFKLHVE